MVLNRLYWILVAIISIVAIWYSINCFIIRKTLISPYFDLVQDHEFPDIRDKDDRMVQSIYLERFRHENESLMVAFEQMKHLFDGILMKKNVSYTGSVQFFESFRTMRESFCDRDILKCRSSFVNLNKYQHFINKYQNCSAEIRWMYIRELWRIISMEFIMSLDKYGRMDGSGFPIEYISRAYNKEADCFKIYFGIIPTRYWDVQLGDKFFYSKSFGFLNEFITLPKSAIKDEKLHLTLIDTLTSERKEIVLDLFYSGNKF